jgi:hypothetical protein
VKKSPRNRARERTHGTRTVRTRALGMGRSSVHDDDEAARAPARPGCALCNLILQHSRPGGFGICSVRRTHPRAARWQSNRQPSNVCYVCYVCLLRCCPGLARRRQDRGGAKRLQTVSAEREELGAKNVRLQRTGLVEQCRSTAAGVRESRSPRVVRILPGPQTV